MSDRGRPQCNATSVLPGGRVATCEHDAGHRGLHRHGELSGDARWWSNRFNACDYATLTFQAPDRERFPALDLGYEAARRGGTAGAALNAADEVAVERFLAGDLPFDAIASVCAEALPFEVTGRVRNTCLCLHL